MLFCSFLLCVYSLWSMLASSNRIVTCVFRMARVCLFDALHSFCIYQVWSSLTVQQRVLFIHLHTYMYMLYIIRCGCWIIYMNIISIGRYSALYIIQQKPNSLVVSTTVHMCFSLILADNNIF